MSDRAKKEQTRARILAGAARTFRSHGYGGAGIDGVASAAGVTSGAFYAYFKSKADAFRETVVTGMQELERGIRHLRQQGGLTWLERFVDLYLGERRTCPLSESCALQSLTGEVARADLETRQAYTLQLRAVVDAVADGVEGPSAGARRRQALVLLALLSGGVSMARAVSDPALAEEIVRAVRGALQVSPKRPVAAGRPPARPRRPK